LLFEKLFYEVVATTEVRTVCNFCKVQWLMRWHSGEVLGLCPTMPLSYWVATLGKLFTHVASPVFSAPRNWGTKGSIRTRPITA